MAAQEISCRLQGFSFRENRRPAPDLQENRSCAPGELLGVNIGISQPFHLDVVTLLQLLDQFVDDSGCESLFSYPYRGLHLLHAGSPAILSHLSLRARNLVC